MDSTNAVEAIHTKKNNEFQHQFQRNCENKQHDLKSKKTHHKTAKRRKSKSPQGHKHFVRPHASQHISTANQEYAIDKPISSLQRSRTSASIIVKSQTNSNMKTSFAAKSQHKMSNKLVLDIAAAKKKHRTGSCPHLNIDKYDVQATKEKLHVQADKDDKIHPQTSRNTKKHLTETHKDDKVYPQTARDDQLNFQTAVCDQLLSQMNGDDKLHSLPSGDNKVHSQTARDSANPPQKIGDTNLPQTARDDNKHNKRYIGSSPVSAKESLISPGSTPVFRRRAWSNDPNFMLKAALLNSPNSTPTIRRKRIDLDFTPKFLSSPSSRQSSSHSFNTADIKVIVYNNGENVQRKQNITENFISKNEKVIQIVDTSVGNNDSVLLEDHIESVTHIHSNPNKKHNRNSKLTKNTVDNFEKHVNKNTLPDILSRGDEYLAEGLTEDVYNKCKKWLEGLNDYQEDKYLELVTLPPIEWND